MRRTAADVASLRPALRATERELDADERAATELAAAAKRFARHDPAARAYLLEMARALRIEILHRRAHMPCLASASL